MSPHSTGCRYSYNRSDHATNSSGPHVNAAFNSQFRFSLAPVWRAAVLHVDCTITGMDNGVPMNFTAPPVIVVPRAVAIPTELRRLPDNSSTVITDPAGDVSFRLTASDDQTLAMVLPETGSRGLEVSVIPLSRPELAWRRQIVATYCRCFQASLSYGGPPAELLSFLHRWRDGRCSNFTCLGGSHRLIPFASSTLTLDAAICLKMTRDWLHLVSRLQMSRAHHFVRAPRRASGTQARMLCVSGGRFSTAAHVADLPSGTFAWSPCHGPIH